MEEFRWKCVFATSYLSNRRYPEITKEIRERLDFELLTISNSGYPAIS
jgi:hypothetical protein